jgi:hypothetical protein
MLIPERARQEGRLRTIRFLAEEAMRLADEGGHTDIALRFVEALSMVDDELRAIEGRHAADACGCLRTS